MMSPPTFILIYFSLKGHIAVKLWIFKRQDMFFGILHGTSPKVQDIMVPGRLGRVWGSRGKARMDFILTQDPTILPGRWQQVTIDTNTHTPRFSISSIQFPQSPTLPASASSDGNVLLREAKYDLFPMKEENSMTRD